MAQAPNRRLRCDYKRLCALKGLERLKEQLANETNQDEVKVIIDAMFYLTQLEVKAEQLKKALRKRKPNEETNPSASAACGSSSTSTEPQMPDTPSFGHFPEDLLDLDARELREFHSEIRESDVASMASGTEDLTLAGGERQDAFEHVLELKDQD